MDGTKSKWQSISTEPYGQRQRKMNGRQNRHPQQENMSCFLRMQMDRCSCGLCRSVLIKAAAALFKNPAVQGLRIQRETSGYLQTTISLTGGHQSRSSTTYERMSRSRSQTNRHAAEGPSRHVLPAI